MIKKENKSVMITLEPENQELLNSLANRFHCSKSDLIKQAIKLFAASKNHHYSIFLREPKNTESKESKYNWDEMINELENETTDDDTKF